MTDCPWERAKRKLASLSLHHSHGRRIDKKYRQMEKLGASLHDSPFLLLKTVRTCTLDEKMNIGRLISSKFLDTSELWFKPSHGWLLYKEALGGVWLCTYHLHYQQHMNECFLKWWVPPKSSILIGFSITNHTFWGTPIFGNTHINNSFFRPH